MTIPSYPLFGSVMMFGEEQNFWSFRYESSQFFWKFLSYTIKYSRCKRVYWRKPHAVSCAHALKLHSPVLALIRSFFFHSPEAQYKRKYYCHDVICDTPLVITGHVYRKLGLTLKAVSPDARDVYSVSELAPLSGLYSVSATIWPCQAKH
jgi:hypothetical protein